LRERFATIRDQSFTDWELVVSDNFSDDGAWEFIQKEAAEDSRILIQQAPRTGLYGNWNNCLARARGEYVYIATSDDTMALECLEKMVAALDAHTDCDLAHCPLVSIDQHSATLREPRWPDGTVFARGMEHIAQVPHIRRAPYDGMIHLVGHHVVLSITQLLIRRSLFERTGAFSSRWGSVGDFNWEMKAGLVASMVHVPDTWASWRRHPTQATATVDVFTPERDMKINEMVDDAIDACVATLPADVARELVGHWQPSSRKMRAYYGELRCRRRSHSATRAYQLAQLLRGNKIVASQMLLRLAGKRRWPDAAPAMIRDWLESSYGRPIIEVL
jgi:hypothetical protein